MTGRTAHKPIFAMLAAVMLLAGMALPVPLRAGGGEHPGADKVLIIASYNPDTRRMASFISEFAQKIAAEKLPYEVLIEDMGCKGLSEAPAWTARMGEVLSRYDKKRLKAVILLGQEAWASFLAQPDFPADVPFFGGYASVSGVMLPDSRNGFHTRDWTPETIDMEALADSLGRGGGYLNEYDIDRNIELIRSLYPDVRHIAFVTDNTYGGISLQALARERMRDYPDLNLILIDSRDGEEQASARIAGLPPNSVLLIGTWRVGREGQYLLFSSIGNLVSANPTLPVFTVSGSGIGSVAIGGYIPQYRSGAAEIARQIADYYEGDTGAVRFIPTAGEYQFDRRKLKEFGIADYKLPTGSVVIDSMEAQLQKYRYYVVVFGVAFVLLAGILIVVFYFYFRNKRLKIALERREKELIVAKEKAEESDHLKSAFLANMSHEIRTPLNAIVGFSTLLGEDALSAEERAEYNSIISKNSELMLTLINDILDFSRLETGRISFVYEQADVYLLCQQALLTTGQNLKPGVGFDFRPARPSYLLETDVQRLSQVLINLLTNACKFTEQGSITLAFEVQEERNRVVFSVADTGCGIPHEQQAKVFNRFEKLNEFKQGTGLGLAICRQIVLKFGGEIWIDPDYTTGARFAFSHPIRRGE
ncbi:MAG: two-component sensor histidine kinase [Rikenellaceae bacterium]|nr:two-component sensor histidine kinase [Rikenellaceae bacterium]